MTAIVTSEPRQRDYSLAGESTREAVDSGLVGSDWYRSPISSDTLKALAQRTDGPAIRDTIVWLAALLVSGVGGVLTWGSWWCVPCCSSPRPRRPSPGRSRRLPLVLQPS